MTGHHLAAAIEANLFAHPIFHARPGIEAHDGPDLLWTLTDVPHPLFNSVLRARLNEETADAAIEEAKGRCAARCVPMLWWTGPSTRPANLGARLEAHGFVRESECPGMAVPLERAGAELPLPAGVAIVEVRDPNALRIWNAVPDGLDARYEFYAGAGDAFRHYLAFVEGKAGGTASLFPAGGVAGIYNVYTVPVYRGRGIGAALTACALRDARGLGCDLAVLQASPLSVPLYRRLGFEEHCTIGHYVWSA